MSTETNALRSAGCICTNDDRWLCEGGGRDECQCRCHDRIAAAVAALAAPSAPTQGPDVLEDLDEIANTFDCICGRADLPCARCTSIRAAWHIRATAPSSAPPVQPGEIEDLSHLIDFNDGMDDEPPSAAPPRCGHCQSEAFEVLHGVAKCADCGAYYGAWDGLPFPSEPASEPTQADGDEEWLRKAARDTYSRAKNCKTIGDRPSAREYLAEAARLDRILARLTEQREPDGWIIIYDALSREVVLDGHRAALRAAQGYRVRPFVFVGVPLPAAAPRDTGKGQDR